MRNVVYDIKKTLGDNYKYRHITIGNTQIPMLLINKNNKLNIYVYESNIGVCYGIENDGIVLKVNYFKTNNYGKELLNQIKRIR